jgi:hypothetical protein
VLFGELYQDLFNRQPSAEREEEDRMLVKKIPMNLIAVMGF